jgi:PAS domain S-box-containing protein
MRTQFWSSSKGTYVRFTLVGTTYFLATLLLFWIYRDDPKAQSIIQIGVLGFTLLILLALLAASVLRTRKALTALSVSEERWSAALEANNDGLWVWDIPTNKARYNWRWAEILEYDQKQLPGTMTFWEQIVHPDDQALAQKTMSAHLLAQTPSYECEMRARTGRNTWKWIMARGRVVQRDLYQKPVRAAGTITDITLRKTAEALMVESESKLRTIINSLPYPIFAKNAQFIYTECNEAFCQFIGRERSEILGTPVASSSPADLALEFQKTDALLMKDGASRVHETTLTRFDGSRRKTVFHQAAYQDIHGAFAGIVGILIDVTERATMESQVRESEARFKVLFNSGDPAFVFTPDLSQPLTEVNEAACLKLGCPRDELLRRRPTEIEPPEQAVRLAQRLDLLRQSGRQTYESLHVLKDGRQIPVEVSIQLFDYQGRSHVFAVARDITERKLAEAARRASEERFRVLFDAVTDAVFVSELGNEGEPGRIIEVNDVACRRLGYSREELLRMTSRQIGAPDSGTNFAAVNTTLRAGQSSTFEEVHLTREGRRIPVEIHAQAFILQERPVVMQIVRDISERRRSDSQLHLLRSALEAAANGILITDVQGRILWVNESFCVLTGYSRAETIGKTPRLLKSGKMPRELYEKLWRTILAGDVWSGELINRRKDGTLFDEEMTITPVHDSSGRLSHFVAIKQDITRRKWMETHYTRTQRLEGISTLASGLAHDLNNTLTPVLMATQVLRVGLNDEKKVAMLERIDRNARRAAEMLKSVLTFARGVQGARVSIHPRQLLRDMAKECEDHFGGRILVSVEVPDDIDDIVGDPTQAHQILLNLCMNARDAMPQGGLLMLRCSNAVADTEFMQNHPDAKPGHYVCIHVTDTGTGMSEDVLSHIFEPFFTTKPPGKGTGLGLATVRGIVKSHNGFVEVTSETGKGSTFMVYLPSTPPTAQPAAEPFNPVPRGQGEWLMVVDDDEAVRFLTEATLEQHGYRIISVPGGHDALRVYKERGHEIAGIIVDIVMPDIDGLELSRMLRDLKPDVHIMAMTGMASLDQIAKLKDVGVSLLIRKPFRVEELLRTVRDMVVFGGPDPSRPAPSPDPSGHLPPDLSFSNGK